jgi:phosphoglycerate kinase
MASIASISLPVFNPDACANKVVLVRVDLNVPVKDGIVQDTTRIERLVPTLRLLIRNRAKVVLLSHLGRPKGKKDISLSLSVLIPSLSKILQQHVHFVDDVIGTKAHNAINTLQPGQVLLLENLRFYPEEEQDDNGFAKSLAELGDIYINDGFAVSHRAHASVHAITQFIPSYAGHLLNDEINALSHAFIRPRKPVMAIVGGSKVSTKLALLKNLVTKVDYLVVGGGIANTFLFAAGYNIGASLCEKDMVDAVNDILTTAKNSKCLVIIPSDVKVAVETSSTEKVREVKITAIATGEKVSDVGHATIETIAQGLAKCQTIVWNGPLGVFEVPPFDQGTKAIAQLIANTHRSNFYSLAGGGETIAALNKSGTAHGFSYLSTGGGAFLEFLEGKQLPGIQALMQHCNNSCKQNHPHSLMKNG